MVRNEIAADNRCVNSRMRLFALLHGTVRLGGLNSHSVFGGYRANLTSDDRKHEQAVKNFLIAAQSMKRLCSDKILGLVRKGDRASGLASVYVYLPSKTQEA